MSRPPPKLQDQDLAGLQRSAQRRPLGRGHGITVDGVQHVHPQAGRGPSVDGLQAHGLQGAVAGQPGGEGGGQIVQETRLFNPDTGTTRSMRSRMPLAPAFTGPTSPDRS